MVFDKDKMKYLFYIICSLLSIGTLQSQTREIDPRIDPRNFSEIYGVRSSSSLCMRSSDLSDHTVLDTSRLVVLYKKSYVLDTMRNQPMTDTMRLSVGMRFSVFFSDGLYKMDSVYTVHDCARKYGGITCYDGGFYYRHIPSNKFTVLNRIPFTKNQAIVYEQSDVSPCWRFVRDTSTCILGYKCLLAQTSYGGRIWSAWFSPEIPVTCGPWKLHGLPGLILVATCKDSSFKFEAIDVEAYSAPIVYFHWEEQRMTSSQWLKLETRMYADPYSYFGNGGNTLFLNLDKSAERPYLDETWTIPYNPIELE